MRYTAEDREEFAKQISDLLKQRLIRPSISPHSSPAFLVRNHAEQKRGKARMVINYKALNENTKFDGPSFSNSRIFSKVDCKSGFWQIMLEEPSPGLLLVVLKATTNGM